MQGGFKSSPGLQDLGNHCPLPLLISPPGSPGVSLLFLLLPAALYWPSFQLFLLQSILSASSIKLGIPHSKEQSSDQKPADTKAHMLNIQ